MLQVRWQTACRRATYERCKKILSDRGQKPLKGAAHRDCNTVGKGQEAKIIRAWAVCVAGMYMYNACVLGGGLYLVIFQPVHMYCSGSRLIEPRDAIKAADQLTYEVKKLPVFFILGQKEKTIGLLYVDPLGYCCPLIHEFAKMTKRSEYHQSHTPLISLILNGGMACFTTRTCHSGARGKGDRHPLYRVTGVATTGNHL